MTAHDPDPRGMEWLAVAAVFVAVALVSVVAVARGCWFGVRDWWRAAIHGGN